MNEKQIADQLNQDVQRMLDGLPPRTAAEEGETGQILEMARMLASSDMSRQSRVRNSLRQTLLNRSASGQDRRVGSPFAEKGIHMMKTNATLSKIAFTVLAAALLVFVAGSIAPVRAFTQQIWQQIGPVIITNQQPPNVPEPAGGPTPTRLPDTPAAASASPTMVPEDSNVVFLTSEQAREQADFILLEPGLLPSGYWLAAPPQIAMHKGVRITASQVYTTDSTAFDGPYLSILQSTFQPEDTYEFQIGDANVSQVQVRGQAAVFVEDGLQMTVRAEDGSNTNLPVDTLLWEEDGLYFMINATRLSLDELIQIAESLH
jgi:hypothetical protein